MPANEPFTLPHRIGSHPFFGCGGLVGGIVLIAAGMGIAATDVFGARGGAKLVVGLGICGLVLIATSFRIVGAEFREDGIQIWKYLVWFLGSKRFIPANEVKAFVLGENAKKYTVTIKFADGSEVLLPQQWPVVKGAQAIIDFGTRQYGAGAEVAIEDQSLLSEAANFSKADRWTVTPRKPSRAEGERLVFENDDGAKMGEIKLLMG